MKKNILYFVTSLVLVACQSNTDKSFVDSDKIKPNQYDSFGGEVKLDKIYSQDAIASTYDNLETGDTLQVAFTSKVNDVCKAKGCWMKVAMDDQNETMVKFKDYGFFVPKDIEGREVIVQGKAYVTDMSVADQKHFAEDAGKSEEEIAAITTPKKTYSFVADAVLVKKD